jgi:glycosyltransferase involved in cell wall biosynthesis
LTAGVSRRPKHLCIVTHRCQPNDGQGRVNYEIVKAALKAGWRVTFLGSELADDLAAASGLEWVRIARSRLPGNLLRYQLFALKSAVWLRRNGERFDVIHVNGFITWHDADVNTAHFVHSGWLRSRYFPYHRPRRPYAVYQLLFTRLNALLERMAFKRAGVVVAVSPKIAVELSAAGVPGRQIATICNGVDLAEFHPGSTARTLFSLPETSVLFLFAGDIRMPRKNLQTVLQALVLAPGLHLAVAGGLAASPYPALAAKLGVADRVYFLGAIVEMAKLMRAVDVFVLPSRYDPLGLVVLEAMASGLPVVTAQSVGAAELLAGGGRVLDDPDDAATLAAWMCELANDAGLRQRMGAAAHEAAAPYAWQNMTDKYLRLYEDIAGAKSE